MQILETERLILGKWSRRDAEELYAYAQNPNVGPAAGWKPHESVGESRRIIREIFRRNKTWKITDRATGRAIGTIGFTEERRPVNYSRELGYSMDEAYWGRGLMTEAATAVIDHAFHSMGLGMISIRHAPENERSRRVIEKLGFHYEGLERRCYLNYLGELIDQKCYSLLPEEWEAHKKEMKQATGRETEREAAAENEDSAGCVPAAEAATEAESAAADDAAV